MGVVSDNLFRKLILDALPTMLRKPVMLAWLLSLAKPVRDLHAQLLSYQTIVRKKLKRNGQTLGFEEYLNEVFPVFGRITLITEAKQTQLVMIGFGTEVDQGFFGGFGTDPDQGVFTGLPVTYNYDYDFIVQLPVGANVDLAKLQSVVKQFKLSGKRFVIRKANKVLGSGSTLEAEPTIPTNQL